MSHNKVSLLISIIFASVLLFSGCKNAQISFANQKSPAASSKVATIAPADVAVIVFTESPGYQFPFTQKFGTFSKAFTINNIGNSIATGINGTSMGVPYQFNGGSYPGTSGTCTSNLPAGASCKMDIVFAPSTDNYFNSFITVPYNNGLSETSASLPVTGRSVKVAFVTDRCFQSGSSGIAGTNMTVNGCDNSSTGKYLYGLSGAFGADQLCQQSAQNAGFSDFMNFRAWASDASNDAYCRVLGYSGTKTAKCGFGVLPTGGGPWYQMGSSGIPNSNRIADHVTHLTSCNLGTGDLSQGTPCLYNPILNNEYGATLGVWVDSGTNWDGTASSCNWLSSTGCMTGDSWFTDGSWTQIWYGASPTSDRHLYCFEL